MKNELIQLYRWIFARPQFYDFNLHLYKVVLRSLGVLNAEGPNITGEAWLEAYLFSQFEIKTIVDVGANTDVFGISTFSDAQIFACEPHPRTFRLLKKALTKNQHTNVIPLNLGLSNTSRKTKLWDFADDAVGKTAQPTSTLSSLNKEIIEELHGQKAQAFPIELTTLDSLAKKYKLSEIDILKIDTEGHELQVLQGAKKLLASNKIHIILFEFNEMNVYTGTFLHHFRQVLPNFQFYRLLPHGLIPLDTYRPLEQEIFGFQNIVCVHQDVCRKVE